MAGTRYFSAPLAEPGATGPWWRPVGAGFAVNFRSVLQHVSVCLAASLRPILSGRRPPFDFRETGVDVPQHLSHGWLVTDPAPERHFFRPGTREIYPFGYDYARPRRPVLPGAGRAYLEGVLPMHQAWARSLADETARLQEADAVHARYLATYDIGEGNPKIGAEIDRYLGPFPHPYPGDRLLSWAMGSGAVADWALAASDASDPSMSRTSRRAAGKRAGELLQAAEAEWEAFRAGLDAWAVDAAAWIDRSGATVPRPRTAAVQLN